MKHYSQIGRLEQFLFSRRALEYRITLDFWESFMKHEEMNDARKSEVLVYYWGHCMLSVMTEVPICKVKDRYLCSTEPGVTRYNLPWKAASSGMVLISEGRVERNMKKQVAREPLLSFVWYFIMIRHKPAHL